MNTLPSNKQIEVEISLLGITYFGFDPLTIKGRKEIQAIRRSLIIKKIFSILRIVLFPISIALSIFANYKKTENTISSWITLIVTLTLI